MGCFIVDEVYLIKSHAYAEWTSTLHYCFGGWYLFIVEAEN